MTRAFAADSLTVLVFDDGASLARRAADDAAAVLRDALAARTHANVLFASGNSQIAFLDELVRRPLDWGRVRGFHMDEYVGIPASHPASFRRYMRERVVARVPMQSFHLIEGDAPDPEGEAERYAALLRAQPIDLCCLGVGENGHLAFNDPPYADFADPRPVKIVELDTASRRQQVDEGHFASIDEVPTRAITVTIPTLLGADRLLAIVPESRKAPAVQAMLEGPVGTACPASVLRSQPHATLYLDRDAASLLRP